MPHRTALLAVTMTFLLSVAPAGARLQSIVRVRSEEPILVAAGEDAGVQSFALGDLNKDARPDVVVIDRENDRFAVLLGRGDGTFVAAQAFDGDGSPTAIAIADLASPFASAAAGNPDGNPDVVLVDEDGGAFLFLGRGDGGFDPPEQELDEIVDPVELVGIAVADFDGNGVLDVALLDAFDEVHILCNGRGALGACPSSLVPTNGLSAVAIAAGDFDGNDAIDLAVLNRDSRDLSVLYGDGTGVFPTPDHTFSATAGGEQDPVDLAVARLDLDADDDLVIANRDNFADVSLLGLIGRPERRFERRPFVGPFAAAAVAVADFDDDGASDAFVVSSQGPDFASLLRGDGTGSLLAPYFPPGLRITSWRDIEAADLTGDGRIDLVTLAADGASLVAAVNVTAAFCAGDCNSNEVVSVDELVLGVDIILGRQVANQCIALDTNASSTVEIHELIAAVRVALRGCLG